MFSTVEDGRMSFTVTDVRYYGGCSLLWKMFSTVEDAQYSREWKDVMYCEGFSVLSSKFIITEDIEYCGGCSVLWRMFSSLEDVQFSGGYSALWRRSITVGDTISTLKGHDSAVEDVSVQGYYQYFGRYQNFC